MKNPSIAWPWGAKFWLLIPISSFAHETAISFRIEDLVSQTAAVREMARSQFGKLDSSSQQVLFPEVIRALKDEAADILEEVSEIFNQSHPLQSHL